MQLHAAHPAAPRPLTVSVDASAPLVFAVPFRIGRASSCELFIPNDYISRVHAEVQPEGEDWVIRDRQSSNGLYLEGIRVQTARLVSGMVIQLGTAGPALTFHVSAAATEDAPKAKQHVIQDPDRYFRPLKNDEPVGEHTMYVRRAFAQVQSRQRRKYTSVIAVLLLAAAAVSAYAFYLRREVMHQRAIAENLFYSIKSLDVEIAVLEKAVTSSNSKQGAVAVSQYETRRHEMEQEYDQFLSSLHVYDPKMTEQQRLILRIARVFGECELDMPPDFEAEVSRYIKVWQSSSRLAHDIRLAKEKGYTQSIPEQLLAQGLPAQFFYLALQESDFDPYVSGPMTRKGIAKGMWQFIPETGVKYGLHMGALVDLPRPDPGDERDQYEKATRAASQYIKMLYSTDAQASGLLVMACYNWGEGQVLPLIRSMPPNPRERNFWRLLSEHRDQIPQQTYDYVFLITAAAVIGENPRLFGFDFDNPLDQPQSKQAFSESAEQGKLLPSRN